MCTHICTCELKCLHTFMHKKIYVYKYTCIYIYIHI